MVFLHEVAKGAADRSYGVQVARLAGLPDAVVERARDVLHRLEEGETSGKAQKIIDDLPLFAIAQKPREYLSYGPNSGAKPAQDSALLVAVGEINPDDLTPRFLCNGEKRQIINDLLCFARGFALFQAMQHCIA